MSYLAPEPSVHTVICMLGSGGIMGDTRLFGSMQYMLGVLILHISTQLRTFVVGGQSLCLISYFNMKLMYTRDLLMS